jgi:hypothetical protein
MEKKVKSESNEKISGMATAKTSPVHDPPPPNPMMKVKGKKVKNSTK